MWGCLTQNSAAYFWRNNLYSSSYMDYKSGTLPLAAKNDHIESFNIVNNENTSSGLQQKKKKEEDYAFSKHLF